MTAAARTRRTPIESRAPDGSTRAKGHAIRPLAGVLRVLLAGAALLSSPALAGDPWEFWPELNLYKTLGKTTRLYFVTAYAEGKESPLQTLDMAGYFDVTLGPPLRRSLRKDAWEIKKYFWARVGYNHSFRQESKERSAPEDRIILAFHGRSYLRAGILFEGRARTEFRWIGGDYSTRYRLRGELNREFEVSGHLVTPYLQAEAFYDTRYDGWARELYQVGAEVGVTKHFRVEPSVARQVDRLPVKSGLYAFAIVARWYY